MLLVWSAVAEFLLLRVFLRLGPMLPRQEAVMPFYRLIEALGLTALNLAALAAGVLLIVAAATFGGRRLGQALLGLSLIAASGVNLGLEVLLAVLPAPLVVTIQAALTMTAVSAVALSIRSLPRGRLPIALAAGAQLLALYHVLGQGTAGLGASLPVADVAPFLAETLAVMAVLALPWSFRLRPRWQHLALGLSLAITLLAAHTARPWTVATIAMWTVSFSLFLPGLVYVLGLGVGATWLLALRGHSQGRAVACGLLLVAFAGLKLELTSLALLGLAGLLVASGHVAALPRATKSALADAPGWSRRSRLQAYSSQDALPARRAR